MEAEFYVRVDCTPSFTMTLMSTLGDDTEGGAGGTWGTRTVGGRAAKAGLEEGTGEVWSHEGRGDFSCEDGGNVMSVGGGRLLGSWIRRSVACSLRSPRTVPSPSTRGMVG